MKIALIGYGNVGRALVRLLESQRPHHPFTLAGIHTARHGTAYDVAGLPPDSKFGPSAASTEEFLARARALVAVEVTPLSPSSGEPAISHIRAAFAQNMHVVTANKGPIAHAYQSLRAEASAAGVEFRFESTVMDGAPVFNMVRHCLPNTRILGFAGVLNSTSKVVIETMEQGGTYEEGVAAALRLGITEADASYDTEGWDSAAKAAALANVFLDAGVTPQAASPRGITRLTPGRVQELARQGRTVRLVSRARRVGDGVKIRVRAEVLDKHDVLASVPGTSNLLLLHTDLMGTIGTVSISPGVDQTAYGIFSDLVDIARTVGRI